MPFSAEPKQAERAAVSHSGGVVGSGAKANAHHTRVTVSQRARTSAGTFEGRIGYPTFHRNDRIFQFAK
jgi:hypothetical protein